jgi:hypothetical protein
VLLPSETDRDDHQHWLLDSGSAYPIAHASIERPPALDIVHIDSKALVSSSATGLRKTHPCRLRVFRVGDVSLRNVRWMLAEVLPGENRFESGILPLNLFDSIYFNSEESFVVLNPSLPR